MNQMVGSNSVRFAGASTIRTISAPTILIAHPIALSQPATEFTSLPSQSGWRWCQKCQGMFYGLNPDQGPCPASGRHDASHSAAYLMTFGDAAAGMQPGWRWCQKCQGLFFGGNPNQTACPAGGPHDASRSGAYLMVFGDGGQGMQAAWRWCQKCQGLFFSGNPNQTACPASGPHDPSASAAYAMRFDPNPPPPKPASLPLVDSRNGNLFTDRNDANLQWYLPEFALADDIDPAFAFLANQSGQDQNGSPFNSALLTLRLHKSEPADAISFSQANPTATLQEIPLAELAAVLTSFYKDDAGQEQQRTFKAVIKDQGNGDFLLTFDSILGPAGVGIFLDLTVFGKAVINLSASYQAWVPAGAVFLPLRFQMLSRTAEVQTAPKMMSLARPNFVVAPAFRVASFGQGTSGANDSALTRLDQTRQTWTASVPLELKYKKDGYQTKYKISTATVANQIIRDVKDLKDFSLSQTEFAELHSIERFGERYQTLSRLYIGVISRTIVAIPRRYSIVRSSAGCAALCMALVDSSAADGSKCKFEFDFTIAPEVSRIEWEKLTQEIKNIEDLKDYNLKLPDFLGVTPPSTLQTTFKSSVDISAGSDPKTFAVTVAIRDDGSQTPAVANANLFILRVCSTAGADLIGSLSLKLDDGFQEPVLSTIDLNFAHTAGTDELLAEIEEGSNDIKLTNKSGLDLQLSRYALIGGPQLAEVPGELLVPKNGSITVPLPPDHSNLSFAAESQIAVPKPMSKSDVQEFFSFHTADVQDTQYVVAVNGSGINFNKVDSIQCSITFSSLPNVTPRPLILNKNLRSDSTHIVIPLQNAVFSLTGTVNVTVHFVDPGDAVLFTVENDFTAEPVLVLLQSDIDAKGPNLPA